MHLFGAAHILWLFGFACSAAALVWLVRQQPASQWWVRGGLALFLVGGEMQRYFHDGMKWPDGLPLNPCNISTWVAVYACFTMAPLAVEFVYLFGLTGAGMALLTPDMGSDWPPRFFLNHGGIVITGIVLVFGRMVRLRPGAIWRVYALFEAYIALIAVFDWIFKTNYAYLSRKPAVSVLSVMGPWPVYIFAAGMLALWLFSLLWFLAPREGVPREAPVPAEVTSA